MKIWLVECWVIRDDEKIFADSTPFASYDLAEQYIKMCAQADEAPLWRGNFGLYVRYITPETEHMYEMEYVIKPKVVIENLG